jgi:predicted PurR-regulated permease PerM
MRLGEYWQRRRSHVLFHAVVYLFGIVVLYKILQTLAPILFPVITAAGIAYLLDPLVDRMERKGVPRAAAVVLILLGFGILVTALLALLVPLVASDVKRFAAEIPALLARASAWLNSQFGIEVPATWREALASGSEYLKRLTLGAGKTMASQLGQAASSILSILGGLLELLLIPVFAFYFLLDWDRIVARLRDLVPPRYRPTVVEVAKEMDTVVSHWVRGQLIVVSILAVLYPIALWIAGIHLAVPVGVLAGILTFIPYVGTAVAFTLAALLALVGWHGPGPLIGVVIVFVLLHLLESLFLTPRLVGKRVGLGEAGALFAAIAGGELLGFVGVMLAIPIAAAVAVLVRRALQVYARSDFFTYDPGMPLLAPEPQPQAEAPPVSESKS